MTPEWQRLDEVFHAALELRGPDRQAFIQRECQGDDELRAHVERLLQASDDAGDFLEAPLNAPSHNRRAGPYRILREIGHGGMGTVYLAERADGQFRRNVAIKLVNPHAGTEQVLRRFRNERQILASLDHPNIARLLDGGSTEDNIPYMVMEYVDGELVDQWCDGRKLSVPARLRLFRQVCDAVQYAHDRGVIHRDLKPGNILITGNGTVKLLDFGIAKVLARDLAAETLETTAGVRPMTPEYASPEQVRGGQVTVASDVYSLGVVLYRLLTGSSPYVLDEHGPDSVGRAICTQEPVKPSTALTPAAALARGETTDRLKQIIGGDLDNIVLTALRKGPERRYSSAAALAADIDRYLEGRPVTARPEPFRRRVSNFARRRRRMLTVAAAYVALLLASTAAWTRFGRFAAERAQQSIVVLPFDNASNDPEQTFFAESISDALIADLSRVKTLRVYAKDSAEYIKKAPDPAAEAVKRLKADVVVQGAASRSGDRAQITVQVRTGAMDRVRWSHTYERNITEIRGAQRDAAIGVLRAMQIELSAQERAEMAGSGAVNTAAYEAYLRGRHFIALHSVDGFKKALRALQEATEADPAYALGWIGLAEAWGGLSCSYLAPNEAMPKAKAAMARALAIDDRLPEVHVGLGIIQHQYEWDWAAAERSYRRAIAMSPSNAWAHFSFSLHLVVRGLADEAIAEAEEARRLDPVPALITQNVAWIYTMTGREGQAIPICLRTIQFYPEVPVTHRTLGHAYAHAGRLDEAIEEVKRAVLDKPSPDSFLGYLYGRTGRRADALDHLNRTMEYARHDYVDPVEVAYVYLGLGEIEKTFEWLEKGYAERAEMMTYLKMDSCFKPLHRDPRYQDLLRRMRL